MPTIIGSKDTFDITRMKQEGWRFYSGVYPLTTRFQPDGDELVLTRLKNDPNMFGERYEYGPRTEVVSPPQPMAGEVEFRFRVRFPDTPTFHNTIFQLAFEKDSKKQHPAFAIMLRGDTLKIRTRNGDRVCGEWDTLKGRDVEFYISYEPSNSLIHFEYGGEYYLFTDISDFTASYMFYYSFGLYSTIKKPDEDVELRIRSLSWHMGEEDVPLDDKAPDLRSLAHNLTDALYDFVNALYS